MVRYGGGGYSRRLGGWWSGLVKEGTVGDKGAGGGGYSRRLGGLVVRYGEKGTVGDKGAGG